MRLRWSRRSATAGDIVDALKAYEQPRIAFGEFIVGHARALGAYMQAQIRTPHEREMAEKYRTTEAVMKETAVPLYMAVSSHRQQEALS